MVKIINRYPALRIEKLAKRYPVLLISGARQTGKTTLARNIFPKHRWVLLDSFSIVDSARKDPVLFLKENPPPVIFDEIQRVPELFQEIKAYVDTFKPSEGSIILTGSQPLQLMKSISETLAGRIGIVTLHPLTVAERLETHHQSLQSVLRNPLSAENTYSQVSVQYPPREFLFRGGFPAMWIQEYSPAYDDVSTRLQDYIATYLTRDLRDFGNIKDLGKFENFLRLLAATTAQIPNITALAGNAGIRQSTAHDWLQILIASEIVIEIQGFHKNPVKRESKRSKYLLADSGLAINLLGYQTPEQIEQTPFLGSFFETMVIQSIYTRIHTEKIPATLSYWRSQEKHEVDLILQFTEEEIYPIEIKYTGRPAQEECKGLHAFMKNYPHVNQGYLITTSDSPRTISEKIVTLPFTNF
jgi:uncharacterized protein